VKAANELFSLRKSEVSPVPLDKENDAPELCWYAVSTKSRQEKIAASMLEGLAVSNFLPLIRERRQWSDRIQSVDVPLFPGYLFVQMAKTGETQLRVLKVPGIVDFVRNRNGPMPVPAGEIASVRRALLHGAECSPFPFLKAGDCVRVTRGALSGMEGKFIRSGSEGKLVISIELIQRSIAVILSVSCVELISERRDPESGLHLGNRQIPGRIPVKNDPYSIYNLHST
jgi:transcription antitermination factor NusG